MEGKILLIKTGKTKIITKKRNVKSKGEHPCARQDLVFPTGFTETGNISHTENWHVFDLKWKKSI